VGVKSETVNFSKLSFQNFPLPLAPSLKGRGKYIFDLPVNPEVLSMPRLFFALWPDDETRNHIDNVARKFKNENIKLVKKSNLHITLEFLGEVSDQNRDQLVEKINKLQLEPFDIELTKTGWWRKPQILWFGTTHTPKALLKLVKSIKKCVKKQGLKTDKREYTPHVTIARKVKEVVIPNKALHIPWQVNSFVLVVSNTNENGAEYQVLKEWFLEG
jgi:2'-5' RNA ligase